MRGSEREVRGADHVGLLEGFWLSPGVKWNYGIVLSRGVGGESIPECGARVMRQLGPSHMGAACQNVEAWLWPDEVPVCWGGPVSGPLRVARSRALPGLTP